MAKFEWSGTLSVGVDEMDEQHKKIVDYINHMDALNEKSTQGQHVDVSEVARLLDDLIRYTLTHFRQEEEFMAQVKFPLIDRHKIIHGQLVAQVKDLKAQFDTTGLKVIPKINSFLSVWLKGHIMGIDRQYGDHVKSNKNVA